MVVCVFVVDGYILSGFNISSIVKKKPFKSLSRQLIRWLMVITIFSLGCTQARAFKPTVKFLNFGMPEIFAVIYLKFKQRSI